jgi:hypothetical protein
MGIEPHAGRRLRRLHATTRNPFIRADLGAILLHHPTVSDAPASVSHDSEPTRLPGFSPRLAELFDDLLRSDEVHAELLSAFAAQAKAIQLVWEAHRRGAVSLPPGVADAVERARALPRFLLERKHSV